MPVEVVLGRNFFDQVTIVFSNNVATITKNIENDVENDIMMIQPCINSEKDLTCLTEIEDEYYRKEVTKMIKEYKPAPIKDGYGLT